MSSPMQPLLKRKGWFSSYSVELGFRRLGFKFKLCHRLPTSPQSSHLEPGSQKSSRSDFWFPQQAAWLFQGSWLTANLAQV